MKLSKNASQTVTSPLLWLFIALLVGAVSGGCAEKPNPLYNTDLGDDIGLLADAGDGGSGDGSMDNPDVSINPGGEPCEAGSGSCCDDSTETTFGSDHACQEEIATDWECSNTGCGGTLRKNITDRFCSGTSSQCDGAERERGWEDHETCPLTTVCDEVAETCAADTQCDVNYCETGECCDLESMSLLDESHVCNPAISEAWRCTSSPCGGAVERSAMVQYCDGQSPDCSGDIEWTDWELVETCNPDAICRTSGSARPECVSNRQQCDPSYCQTGTCCNLETNTLYGQEQVCAFNYSSEQRCSLEPGTCGGDVEFRTSNRHCSGTSSACDGQVIPGQWILSDTCSETETCNPTTFTCADTPSCHDDYCQSGVCCNTQTNRLYTSVRLCAEGISPEYRCADGVDGCGANVEVRNIDKYCSGTSPSCDGHNLPGEWNIVESCLPSEMCNTNSFTCEFSSSCRADYCTSGACCDVANNTLRNSDYLCAQNLEQDLRCVDANQCGSQIVRREKVQYCSGASPTCDGQEEWQELDIEGQCQLTETCTENGGVTQCTEDPMACLPILRVVTGSYHTVALKNDSTVRAWGGNDFGQLGLGDKIDQTTPTPVQSPDGNSILSEIKGISAGNFYTMALKNDGTVWGWGSNAYGRLGIGSKLDQTLPVQVKGFQGQGFLQNITSIAANGRHSLAIDGAGTVWAWGRNAEGQLGDGTTTERLTPVQVKSSDGILPFTGVRKILTGMDHTIALKNDGTVWAWGKNDYGQLGHGNSGAGTNVNLPGQVLGIDGVGTLSGVNDIAAGEVYSLALMNDGSVVAWGRNSSGQLGDGTTADKPFPVKVLGENGLGFLSGITALASMDYHTLAIKDDGTMRAWGSNNNGQLGDGTTTVRLSPVTVMMADGTTPLGNIMGISAGYRFSVALSQDGTIWAWGRNDRGQFGNGSTTNSSKPVQTNPF